MTTRRLSPLFLSLFALSPIVVSAQTNLWSGTVSNTGGPVNLTVGNEAYELTGDTTLTGSSSFVMIGNPVGTTGTQIGTNSVNYTLFNQTTIVGSGTIGANNIVYQDLSLNNSGTINANSNGNTLEITGNGAAMVNSGLFEATNGGTLILTPLAAINNTGGNITASGTGSIVQVDR